MSGKSTSCALVRDILEWNVPEEVLSVLLKDRSTGSNLIWSADGYFRTCTIKGSSCGSCFVLTDDYLEPAME